MAPSQREESHAEFDADVIVLGAGAAGLAASRRLAEGGRSVLLLEARPRVGGRAWTVEDTSELGAEFVHGRPPVTLALLGEAGLGLIAQTGGRWVLNGNELVPSQDWSVGLPRILERARQEPVDISVADFLAAVQRDPTSTLDTGWIRRLVEQFDAADPVRASLQAIIREWSGDTLMQAGQGRPERGYGALIEYLRRSLDPARVTLRLESPVRAVRWTRGAVEMSIGPACGPQVRGRSAVITLPLGVLQARAPDPAAVEFLPPLTHKRDALAGLAMGSALKVWLGFLSPFWERLEQGRWKDAGMLQADGVDFRTLWTRAPERSRWLNAWAGGPGAAALSAAPDDVVIARAVASVQGIFGPRVDVASLLEEARYHNWDRDPFARGAYSYVLVGGDGARAALAAPIEDTLFFAGEATDDDGEAATVAGALASGARAAQQLLDLP